MFWKILGAVVAIWIAAVVLGAIVKSLFPILALAAVVFGLYLLFKAMSKKDRTDLTV